jgi:hypothetical protein
MKPKKIVLLVVGLLAAGAAAVGVTAAMSSRSAEPPPIEFAAVSSQTLAAAGINLVQTSDAPPIPQAAAERIATAALGGAASREALFARCDVGNSSPQVHSNCWAVSLDPSSFRSHGPRGSRTMPARYLVALIDPQSGNFLLAEAGA